ncbi:UDP-2,4-diacetamido-2,4,6-trideoxy-beta-L-altropyranose hydrolase [Clostridium beijerinckii]|jgi:pseudaminic acid biosynthesis-associated protein PseG|uniref:Glycosyltransferase n=2 Tax=Clostridium beijerinckii TaxID=1520 RepID=A6M1A7_CLOB8|nr:UDP-2,4-diacetamido-2,4,6-trideoxy-beta-L-altropyranose hydrolase [Clostridium beijerinckii]ABR36387.1 glycosyltransferase [Clostridium beijerinckii NCIMB 8052]AIU00843.1 glycosyltransferase [Clostridium beijerinckii ATCC 35702]NRT22549.1 UDP-2,4-diacetamido-2,4,6-trideoxy-beta-L-altropyranose hydrolase [Clostridium beijerinckii]NRT64935.1 UDP-2,4-diacetamido-2,4,6-trideoxy-beta-L-altropyranose hydrolase [Clostridium beijerinckii]NRT83542.1 UDP-2,4-diacetamido-2,4,6-trideoxy-beta-L-altropyr
MMVIFIRADGGNSIGLGHVMRMLVLAKELSSSHKVFFLCRDSSSDKEKYRSGIEKIIENNFIVITISEENVIGDILNLQEQYRAKLLITDSYEVNEEYFNILASHFKYTGYVDDTNKIKMNVSFIINQNFNAEYMDYSRNINFGTKLFLGTKYCMIREEFRNLRLENKMCKEKVTDVLLTLGGMDKDQNTLKILRKIKDTYSEYIHVVIGMAFDYDLERELIEISKINSNIKLYKNPIMSELMKKCDIAISACGSTLYELCSMRIPTIGVVVADNQEIIAKQMSENGIIIGGKWINTYENSEIRELLNYLIIKGDVRKGMISKQMNLVNINGVTLLKEEIEKMCI